jgi:hypothetical protein
MYFLYVEFRYIVYGYVQLGGLYSWQRNLGAALYSASSLFLRWWYVCKLEIFLIRKYAFFPSYDSISTNLTIWFVFLQQKEAQRPCCVGSRFICHDRASSGRGSIATVVIFAEE